MTHRHFQRYHFKMILFLYFFISSCTDNLTIVENHVTEVQKKVVNLQEAVSVLQLAYQEEKVIQSIEFLSDSSIFGWDIIFSDKSSIYIEDNGKLEKNNVIPYLEIDEEEYWCASYDGGNTFNRILDSDGKPFYSEGINGNISIRVMINANGNYVYEVYSESDPDIILNTIITPHLFNNSHIVSSIIKDKRNSTIMLIMADKSSFIFSLDVIYPSGIVLLSNSLSLEPNSISSFEFRINPSNAVFNLNVQGEHPQLELDKVCDDDDTRTSYVTPPINYKLIKVEHSYNENGEVMLGQYKAYVQDQGITSDYNEKISLVLSTKDEMGNSVQLSSSLLYVFSGNKGNSFLSFGASSSDIGISNALGISGNDISICLPYGTDISNLIANFTVDGGKVYVNGIEQISGITVNDFSNPLTYKIYSKQGVIQEYKVVVYCFDLPVVYVTTPQQTPILSKEEWIKNSTIRVWKPDGMIDDLGETSMKGRGNSTWGLPKKPYAIKLDKKAEVLGMPKHKRWVLLANWADDTLMRNHIAFTIARSTQGLAWTPRGEFVELILNGMHLGNYYLCEQIKVDENRVNIEEMESTDIEDNRITGGYLLELDTYYDEINKFRTNLCDLPVNIKEPDEDILTNEQLNYIRNYVNQAEKTIYADGFSINGHSYTEYIDVNSFVDWWMVHELTRNMEPQWPKSSYMYKDRNGKLMAGPVWDFDMTTFEYDNKFCIKDAIWYGRLFEDPNFVALVKQRWSISKPNFEAVITEFDNITLRIKNSAEVNSKMWPITIDDNGSGKLTFEERANFIKKVYQDRILWMDGVINNL